MEVDGINLAVGGGAVSAIAGIAGAWIKAKFGKTTVPQPLETREEPRFVTCDQCAEHRKAINARIDEERSIQTHRRLDPLVEEIGRLRGKVEIVEKAAVNATIGGKK